MKTLKQISVILLLLVAISFNSCKSKDDGPSEKIIGSWTLKESFSDGELIQPTACEKQSTIIFASNGTFTEADYFQEGQDCINDGTISGTWENTGNNGIYTITAEGDTVNVVVSFSGNTVKFTIGSNYTVFEK